MKFTEIKNQVKDLWEYDGESIWTSDKYEWFSSSVDGGEIETKGPYFLEFFNDSRDNFFRIYDSNGNDIGIVDGNELKKIQFEEIFCNFIFNEGVNYMFSKYKPV